MSDIKDQFDAVSNKKFGYSVGAILFLISIYLFVNFGYAVATPLFLISVTLLLSAKLDVEFLTSIKIKWMQFGQIMHRIISPLILGCMYYVMITPVGLISRFFGRDELKIKGQKADSYWKLEQTNRLGRDFTKQY